jgi:hypothetical protein
MRSLRQKLRDELMVHVPSGCWQRWVQQLRPITRLQGHIKASISERVWDRCGVSYASPIRYIHRKTIGWKDGRRAGSAYD